MCPDDLLLSRFLDHALPVSRSEWVEYHVDSCEDCRARLRRYQRISHRLLECDEPDVEEVAMRIWSRVAGQTGVSSVWRRWSLRLPIAAATAVVTLAVVFSMSFGKGVLGDHVSVEPVMLQPVTMSLADTFIGSSKPPEKDVPKSEKKVLELVLPDSGSGRFRSLSAPVILHETELSSVAFPPLFVDDPEVTLKIQLPPARYRMVGVPSIWHEIELQPTTP